MVFLGVSDQGPQLGFLIKDLSWSLFVVPDLDSNFLVLIGFPLEPLSNWGPLGSLGRFGVPLGVPDWGGFLIVVPELGSKLVSFIVVPNWDGSLIVVR